MNKPAHDKETKKKICDKCQGVVKNIDIMRRGKKIRGHFCGCGTYTKKGEKID